MASDSGLSRREELLAVARNGDVPDVVLLDVMMPGMDGLATLKNLKAAHPMVQVIMLSGKESAPTIVERLEGEDAEHFAEVRALLEAAGIAFEIDPTLVRGLDYYSRTIFSFVCDELGAQSEIGGGGRWIGRGDTESRGIVKYLPLCATCRPVQAARTTDRASRWRSRLVATSTLKPGALSDCWIRASTRPGTWRSRAKSFCA